MTCRVQEDAEGCPGLIRMSDPTEIDHDRLGGIEIVDEHVEVHLLGPLLGRPRRRCVVRHLMKRDVLAVPHANRSPVGGDLDLPVQQRAIEPGKRTRIGTVNDDEGQASDGHVGNDIDGCGRPASILRRGVRGRSCRRVMPQSPAMHEIVTAALVRAGRVLLVHRSPNRHAYPDVWDLPGGPIEADETELAALAREMHEELGVRIIPGSAIHLCRLEAGHGEESVRFSAWLVGEWEGTPTNVAPDEHDEIRWFRPEEVPPLAHELMGPALVEAMRSART